MPAGFNLLLKNKNHRMKSAVIFFAEEKKLIHILLGGCEWRLVKIEETVTGAAKKVVKFDRYEACYSKGDCIKRCAVILFSK